MRQISRERVLQLFDYDPLTGAFTHKPRPLSAFTLKCIWARFEKNYAGKLAGKINSEGYRSLSIDNLEFLAHRVAWVVVYGALPNTSVDHINGIRTDNRIENLRLATSTVNGRNQRRPQTNTSGHVGVSWHKQKRKWHACIKVDGRKRSLGYFDEILAAVSARKNAERANGFHLNHGS